MWHFLSLLRVHFVWSVNVWKALKRYFSERTAACQKKHGGSLAGAFDLICRSAVMLWHFRHNSGLGQTNHLWYGKLAHFTFYLSLCCLHCLLRCMCEHMSQIFGHWCTVLVLYFVLCFFLSSIFPSSFCFPICKCDWFRLLLRRCFRLLWGFKAARIHVVALLPIISF